MAILTFGFRIKPRGVLSRVCDGNHGQKSGSVACASVALGYAFSMSIRRPIVLFFVLGVVACGGSAAGGSSASAGSSGGGTGGGSSGAGASAGGSSGGGSSGGGTPVGGTPAAAPAADDVSYSGSFAAGGGHTTLTVGGQTRHLITHVGSNRGTGSPALVIALHGTGAAFNEAGTEYVEENHRFALTEMGVIEAADTNGFVVVAPASSLDGGTNADHDGGGIGWRFDGTASSNPDLLLVRAAIKEAQRAYQIDTTHVYVVGHSNGGFFSYYVARMLSNRIAAFAESAAGLIACGNRVDCAYQAGGATSCSAVLASAPSSCTCAVTSTSFPQGAAPAGARIPAGYLSHAADDSTVSPVFTCRLAETLGTRASVSIRATGEHGVAESFMANAWAFLAARSVAD